MSKDCWLVRALVGTYCVAALLVCGQVRLALGQEAAPPQPPDYAVRHSLIIQRHFEPIHKAAQSLIDELGPGWMVRITKAPTCETFGGPCGQATACEEMIARLGTGAEAQACEVDCQQWPARFVNVGCPCTETGECHCAEAVCGSDCAAACKCCPCAGDANRTAQHEAAFAAHAEHAAPQAIRAKAHEHCPYIEQIAKLAADQAAARAELASRKEASEKFAEMYETMAELMAANAALHAKLEAQEEHLKLAEKLAHLAAENARLKAHVELAGSREAGQHALTLSVENERLKLRVAELEHKRAEGEEARSASSGRNKKIAR
jgi:hypothetical protein